MTAQAGPHPHIGNGSGSGKPDRAFVAAVTFGYVIALAIGLARHEIWRDEAKAWLIARDSRSVTELFNNRRYEGHPIGWYLPLYALSRFTRNPMAMQVVHGLIASAAVVVFARGAPFTRLQRLLFAFGVFPLFEFGMVSRCYALGLLLLGMLLWAFHAKASGGRRRSIAASILVMLLASTSLYGLLIAVAYVMAWSVREFAARRAGDGMKLGYREALAAAICLAGIAAAAWQVVPPPPIGASNAGRFASVSEPRFAGMPAPLAIGTVWEAYLPLPNVNGRNLYENLVAPNTRAKRLLRLVVSVLLVAGAAWALRRSKAALTFYAAGTALILALTWLKFGGSFRHHAHLFVVLLGATWIARAGGAVTGRRAAAALTALLSVHAAAGAYYWGADVRGPYAPGREAARVLRERYGDQIDLVSNPGNYASPIQAYLDLPVYFPARHAWGTFELLDGTPKRASREQLIAALEYLCAHSPRSVILVSSEPVDELGAGLWLQPVVSLPRSLSGEAYEVYAVHPLANDHKATTRPAPRFPPDSPE
jgi:hypothetical protein